jgi:hypothetical protein
MAKKRTKGLLDDDFQSLTYKEKKSKIKDIKIPTVKDTNITGDKAIEYGFAGGKNLGEKGIGAIKTKAQEQNKTQKNGEDVYKDSDGKVVSKFDSKIDTTNKYKGKKGDKLDKIEKRVAKRQGQKEERKNYRATKLAKRRGLSPEQAKEFMQNRRNRLNQAMGEFGKGLMGKQQNLGNIENRMYRKKGTGTLQNMKSKDGGTYDATAPYKGTAEKGYADRGVARDKIDTYTKIMGPKVNIKPADPIKLSAFRGQTPKKEKIQNITDNNTRQISDPIVVTKGLDSIQSRDQVPPNRIVRDNIRTRDSGGFYNTEATGNQAMQNAKQRQSSDSLNELLSKVTINPNDILDDINFKKIDRPTGAFRSRRRSY